MNRLARLPVIAIALIALMVSLTGCEKLKARDQLNKGVAAYKAGKFEEAVRHFQSASQLDPTLPTAKAYLATALSQDVVQGLTTPDNMKKAQQAIDMYKEVLTQDPHNINSLKGIASLYFNTKRLDDAKEWQKKVLAEDSKDPEAAYTVGVVDWTEAHENLLKTLPAGMNDDGAGNAKLPKKDCEALQAKNGPLVEEGMKYLNQAIENRPNYDDAMSYLNLTYRRKADIECGNDADRKADVAKANDWSQKAMGTRKENEAKKNQGPGGITMDANGNMK
jgi:tetratricopeptide (TPR) repeat protein